MSFLPIVERELKVALRRRTTLRLRWWAALAAMVMCGFWLLAVSGTARNPGATLFSILTWEAFGLAVVAGISLTAQCLTEEKRAGTLGLLFLTELKGWDVVLGKFAAQSVAALYALLGLLPMLGLPLLLGGVTGGEFWRMALALVNALFFFLGTGICVSAFMRDSQRALGNAFGLALLIAVAIPVAGELAVKAGWNSGYGRALEALSPMTPFLFSSANVYPSHRSVFWGALAISNLAAWALLGLASGVLPRTWQEREVPDRSRRRFGRNAPAKPGLPRRMLAADPVAWLRRKEMGVQWRAWAVVLLWTITVALVLFFGPEQHGAEVLGAYTVLPFGFALKLLFALEACRFFAEARKNGALELLLCTPLTDREIIRGQLVALARSFAWPVGVFLVVLFAPLGFQLVLMVTKGEIGPTGRALSQSVLAGVYSVRMILDLLALCWFGMALALTMKRPRLAPLWTILVVLVLPSVLCWADTLVDIGLIAWGTQKCRGNLRRLISQEYEAPGLDVGPAVRRVPPVISPSHRVV